jgi:hypothetical protein
MGRSLVAPLIAALLLAGCGSSQQADSATPAPTAAPETSGEADAASDPNTITAEQIAATGAATAFEVVDRLHREWLRDKLSGGAVSVYQDNQKLGGEDALRDLQVQDVAALQYLDGRTAIMRWGADASGGVIVVVRNRE